MGIFDTLPSREKEKQTQDIAKLKKHKDTLTVYVELLMIEKLIIPEEATEFKYMLTKVEQRYLSKYPESIHKLIKIYANMNLIMLYGTMFPGAEDIKKGDSYGGESKVRNFRTAWQYYKDEIIQIQKIEPFFGKMI